MGEKEEDVYQIIKKLNTKGIKVRNTHIEMYAAAYFKKTNLDPEDVELVETLEITPDGRYKLRWVFERKAKTPGSEVIQ